MFYVQLAPLGRILGPLKSDFWVFWPCWWVGWWLWQAGLILFFNFMPIFLRKEELTLSTVGGLIKTNFV